MFHIDIATLRDPATLSRIRTALSEASLIVQAFRVGETDADDSSAFQSSLSRLIEDYQWGPGGIRGSVCADLRHKLHEAYNLGWDTVRLQRGVNKNAK